MDTSKQFFRPEAIQVSQFHYYSLGVVAENMAISSKVIFVTPTEEYTMLDGELNADKVVVSSDGQDASGATYATNVQTSNAITATWLPMCGGNRLTAPNVRRGAQVVLYQFGDADKFYWTTLHDDHLLRKLETVIWGFSGTKDEGVENGPDNMYYLELSTHTGLVAFHTSVANGEFTTWDVQINTKEGKLTITDGVGQSLWIDARAHTVHMENVDQSIIDITKQICTITTLDQINMKTKTWTVNAETANLNLTTTNLKGTTWNIDESTTKMTSPTTEITANSSLKMTAQASFHVTSNNLAIDGAMMNVTSENVTFEGLAFEVLSPIIVLG